MALGAHNGAEPPPAEKWELPNQPESPSAAVLALRPWAIRLRMSGDACSHGYPPPACQQCVDFLRLPIFLTAGCHLVLRVRNRQHGGLAAPANVRFDGVVATAFRVRTCERVQHTGAADQLSPPTHPCTRVRCVETVIACQSGFRRLDTLYAHVCLSCRRRVLRTVCSWMRKTTIIRILLVSLSGLEDRSEIGNHPVSYFEITCIEKWRDSHTRTCR